MKQVILLFLFLLLPAADAPAQFIRDDFNRPAVPDLAGSMKWRKVLDLTDPAASMQINPDSTISPVNPLGPGYRGAVYWDSVLSGRFQVGIVLRHKSGSDNTPVFHLHLMNDSSWITGNGYGLRFQENAGTDRFDIQRLAGSGTDTPFVELLATFDTEFSEGDTLMFKFYEDGTKTAVRYGLGGGRDSLTVVDTLFNPSGWYAWVQARVFTDSVKLDDFMVGPIPYGITASAGPGGTISPAGAILVNPGADTTFAITPETGFGIGDVFVDSVSVGTPPTYQFAGVSADHTIEALFDTLTYTITAGAGPNGSIDPSGAVTVNYGTDRSFTVTPDPGYHLDSLLVDSLPVDSTTGYTFTNLTADHTITAYFSINAYIITATAGPNGSISPAGSVPVIPGADQSFTFTPDAGFFVDSAWVDGLPVDSLSGYTFTGVSSSHTISVTFTKLVALSGNFPVLERWNIVSVPLVVDDFLKTTLYPSASSDAYAYSGGYTAHDTLSIGRAYWLKFPGDDSVSMTGYRILEDTVDVEDGWNMVGSVSVPVPVANVGSIPGGLLSSGFFAYTGSYELSPVIEPGRGYWVKITGIGSLVLSGEAPASAATAIKIVPTDELPPSPPDGGTSEGPPVLPSAFSVSPNYPNPFNPSTKIDFALPAESYVELAVYNVLGEEVARLVDGMVSAGRKSVRFDAGGLPSGVYTYCLLAGGFKASGRMLLMK